MHQPEKRRISCKTLVLRYPNLRYQCLWHGGVGEPFRCALNDGIPQLTEFRVKDMLRIWRYTCSLDESKSIGLRDSIIGGCAVLGEASFHHHTFGVVTTKVFRIQQYSS